MSHDKCDIEKLRGAANWGDYKYQIECEMRGRKIWKVITGELKNPGVLAADADAATRKKHKEELEKYEEANDKAIALISRTLTPPMLKIAQQETQKIAKLVWERFERKFEAKTEHRDERLFKELWSIKLEDSETPSDTAIRIMEIWNQLQEAHKAMPGTGGIALPDYILIIRITEALGPEHETFCDIWDAVPTADRTIDNLLMKIEKRELNTQSETAIAVKATTSGQNSKTQSTRPVSKSKYKSQKKSQGNGSVATNVPLVDRHGNPITCWSCGDPTHRTIECPKLAHKPKATPMQKPTTTGKGSIAIAMVGRSQKSVPNYWIADSGASEHITPYADKMVNFKKFTEPTFVQIGDGTPLEAVGSGEGKLIYWRDGKECDLTLYNVWLVPKMSCNLYSVRSAFRNAGYEFGTKGDVCWMLLDNEKDFFGYWSDNAYKMEFQFKGSQPITHPNPKNFSAVAMR